MSDTRSSAQVAFREEPDRLLLVGTGFELAFSTLANGAVVSVRHHRSKVDLVESSEATAEGVLWAIRLVSGTGATANVTNRTCDEFAHSVTTDARGGLDVQLLWRGLRAGAARLPGQVVAHFAAAPDSALVMAELQCELPEGVMVGEVEFPRVGSLGASGPLAEEGVFLPLGDGILVPNPSGPMTQPEGRAWEVGYPVSASMQIIGYYRHPGVALWLSCRDGSGARKSMVAGGMPHSRRLVLSLIHYPQNNDDGRWRIGYPIAIGVLSGDWYEAGQAYRLWALRQPWCGRGRMRERQLPALTNAPGLWLSHWGDGESANTAARDLIRHANAPIRLDWRDWHQGEPPDYFPPRGGDKGFAQAVRELAESGVYLQLAFGGLASAARPRVANASATESQGAVPALGASSRYWRDKIVRLAAQGTARGAEGVYFEGLGRALPVCGRDEGDPRAVGDPHEWAQGLREILSGVRQAVGESYHVAADGPAELCLEFLDAFVTTHTAAERAGLVSDRLVTRWSPLPMFTAVYHGYCAHIACGPSLVCSALQAPEVSVSRISASCLPETVAGHDFQAQFCLEIARGMIWGRQLALANFAVEQGRDERNRRKLAFLAAALRAQTWGVGALLPGAEFLGSLAIHSASIEVDLLVNPRGERDGPRLTRTRMSPVLGAAWCVLGGGNALVMANIHDQPVQFTALLDPNRMVLDPPLHLVGRTFSEDGDAPAATLRASGTEVGGRLPARCVLLVTLY